MKEYLETCGIFNINKTELAKKYGCSDKTIARDIQEILQHSEPKDANLILRKFDQSLTYALENSLRALAKAQGTRETIDCCKGIAGIVIDYLASLKSLGYSVGCGTGDVFTVESLRELVLKRAESEQRSIVSVLSEILDIKIKFSNRDFKEFLNSEKKTSYIEKWPVKTKPDIKPDPPRPEPEEDVLIPLTEAELKELQENEEEESDVR